MSIAAYRKKRTTIVTLDDLIIRVRTLSVADFAELGHVPRAYILAQANPDAAKESSAEDTEKKTAYAAKLQKTVLVNCTTIVDSVEKPTGEKIVDKEPDAVGENEISWKEITPPDANKLTSAATNMSGMSQEAAKAAAPFPQE